MLWLLLLQNTGNSACGLSSWGFSSWGSVAGASATGASAAGAQQLGLSSWGFSSWGSVAGAPGLYRAQAQLLQAMWDVFRSGIEFMSPALAGGFSITEHQEGSLSCIFMHKFLFLTFSPNFLTTISKMLPMDSDHISIVLRKLMLKREQ